MRTPSPRSIVVSALCAAALLLLGVPASAAPDVKVNWATPAHDQINISVDGYDELRKECVKSGFQVRYRFELQLCRPRTLWLDSCHNRRLVTHAIEYDPVGDSYKVVSDLFGDQAEPTAWEGSSEAEALAQLTRVKAFPLAFLGGASDQAAQSYVTVRVLSECKGEYDPIMSKLSYFLSLGLIRISGFDSGWIHFDLGSGQ